MNPKPALVVRQPENDANKHIYWSSLDWERDEKVRHSFFWFVDRVPPREMPKRLSIDALLAWKRVEVNVMFRTTAKRGNVVLEQDVRRCMQHLLITGTNCSYNVGVDNCCNKAHVDPRRLTSIYMEEAHEQGLVGQVSCTECMSYV
jgi:hypothetical protein